MNPCATGSCGLPSATLTSRCLESARFPNQSRQASTTGRAGRRSCSSYGAPSSHLRREPALEALAFRRCYVHALRSPSLFEYQIAFRACPVIPASTFADDVFNCIQVSTASAIVTPGRGRKEEHSPGLDAFKLAQLVPVAYLVSRCFTRQISKHRSEFSSAATLRPSPCHRQQYRSRMCRINRGDYCFILRAKVLRPRRYSRDSCRFGRLLRLGRWWGLVVRHHGSPVNHRRFP